MPATARQLADLEADPLTWRLTLFEQYLTDTQGQIVPDAPHHRQYWTWLWAIERGHRPKPFIAIWPRGGAKSTNAELGTVALGARGRRKYAWYICEKQEQADDHVATISSMLESREVALFYPTLARRRVGKYGSSRAWRRNRLWTAAGFVVDALGLDTAARGIKLEEQRPDWLVFDDVDGRHDSKATTDKKQTTITDTLLPAGSEDRGVLGIQNLIHPDSIFDRIANGDPDLLNNRILSGPIPAVEDLTYQQRRDRIVITGGTPTWVGMDLARCQADIDEFGISAFLREAQHEVEAPPGGMFDHLDLAALRVAPEEVPATLTRVVCWVDPAVTKTDQSDSHAVQVDGIDGDQRTGTIYRLYSWEARATPLESLCRAILVAARYGASYVGVETDQGGDTWTSVFREAKNILLDTGNLPDNLRAIKSQVGASELSPQLRDRITRMSFRSEKAGQGGQPKAERAGRMLADYEKPGKNIVHVIGTHITLERALRRFPKTAPLDLVDAGYWAWRDLREGPEIAGGDPELTAEEEAEDPYTAERHSRLWS